MAFLLVLLVLALLTLAIWNFLTFKKLRKEKDGEDDLKNARYWELHYKMDYLVAVVFMGASVLAFLGFESIQGAKETVKIEIDKELITIKDDISRTEGVLKELKIISDSVRQGVSVSDQQISSQLSALADLQRKIYAINAKNIVQQEFYVVRGLKLQSDHDLRPGENRVYFKTLKTDSGDKLPEFTNTPLVIPISEKNFAIDIFNITNDSFEVWWGNFVPPSGVTADMDNPFVKQDIPYSIVIIGR